MANINFINECKNRANGNRLGKIIVDGIDTPITNSDNLQSIEIDSGCYVDGNIIGSVCAKCLKANFIADNNNLTDKSIQAQIGVKYADLSEEYINMGKYKAEHTNNEITAQYSQITAYDELYTNLDTKYVCNINYSAGNKTVADVYIDVCKNLGLVPVTTTFINSTIKVIANPFTNGESNRTVLQTIAKIACSFIDIDNDTNKIDLCWLSASEEPDYIFEYNDGEKALYSTVEGGQVVCGPINCLIIKSSQVDDENITIKDEDSIEINGEHSIVISEDYILYNADLREQAITSIWNRVNGMKYVDCKLTTYYGVPFLKLGSKIRVYTSLTDYFDTYVLKHNFTFDGTFMSVIESPALTEQEVKRKQDVGLKELLRDTQIEINKQKNEINILTSKQIDTSNEVTQLGIATLTNCMSTDLYKLSLKGDFVRQYDLVNADNTTYPVYFDVYLVVESGNDTDRYKLPLDHLSHVNDTYDEFLIEDNKIKFIKRIGTKNNKKYILSTPIETDLGNINIKLYQGTNKIYLENFKDLQISAKYLIENPYTETFADKYNLISQINLCPENIKISSSKLDVDAIANFTNSKLKDSGSTEINGDNITTGKLKSKDYKENETGMCIDLDMGTVDSKNFTLNENGDVNVAGYIESDRGLLTNLQFKNGYLSSLGQTQTSYSGLSIEKTRVELEVYIPENFEIVSAILTLDVFKTQNIFIGDSEIVNYGKVQNIRLYRVSNSTSYTNTYMGTFYINGNGTEIAGAFGENGFTATTTETSSVDSIDIKKSLNSKGITKLYLETADDLLEYNQQNLIYASEQTQIASAVLNVIGYMKIGE